MNFAFIFTTKNIVSAVALSCLFVVLLLTIASTRSDQRDARDRNTTIRQKVNWDESRFEEICQTKTGKNALPIGIGTLLCQTAFELDTGEISPKLVDSLGIYGIARKNANQIVRDCIKSFKSLESTYAEVVSSKGQQYIWLKRCDQPAGDLFQVARLQLSEIVDKEAARVIVSHLRSQLRNGGENQMEIGFVLTSEGGFLLSERTLGEHGIEIALKESMFANQPDFSSIYRWEFLQNVNDIRLINYE